MAKRDRVKITEQPLAGGRFSSWAVLLWENGFRVQPRYWLRALYVTVTTALFSPLRWTQRLLYWRRIRRTALNGDPIFIIGHYRSGTTFVQNVLTEDPQWGIVSTHQALLPEIFLLPGPWRWLFSKLLPEKRPMDNVAMAPDFPEEPEHALGGMSRYCFYHGFSFPRRMMAYYRRRVALEGLSARAVNRWGRLYRWVLKCATLVGGGRRLMLKNPADTGRIPQMLAEFPNAKFIFLVRDPYTMFYSIRNFYRASIKDFCFHDLPDEETLKENIFGIYEQMFQHYLSHRVDIPDGNLIEMRFEDFERDPLEALKRIYETLGLPHFDEAEPHFKAYVDAQRGYKKNAYPRDSEIVREINKRWGFTFEPWGYELDTGATESSAEVGS